MTSPTALTRVDAVALWHAVQAFDDFFRAMKDVPGLAECLPAERQRLDAAKRALRKVQAQVREAKKKPPALERQP